MYFTSNGGTYDYTGNVRFASNASEYNLQNFSGGTSGGIFASTASVTIESGATARLNNTGAYATIYTFDALNGAGTWINDTASNQSMTLSMGNNTGSGDFSGVIGAANASRNTLVIKNGTGTQTLSGVANTYRSATTINGGTLEVKKLADHNTTSSIGTGASQTLGNSALNLVINGGTLKFSGETGNGSTNRLFTIGASGATLDASSTNNTALTFTNTGSLSTPTDAGNRTLTLTGTTSAGTLNSLASVIVDPASGGGKTAVTKSGTNTWVLSGANSYTGDTLVSAGTLLVNGSLGDTAVTVAEGATIGGTGIIEGSLSFVAGAKLNIGDIDNILTVEGGVTFGNFSITDITGWDFTEASNGTYTLFDGSGFDLDNMDYVAGNPYEFGEGRSAYFEAGLNGLNLTVIPEPAAALLGGLGMIALLRRRRA